MTTALDIINSALELIQVKGAGETVSGDDSALALNTLTGMLDAWQVDTQAPIGLTELVFTPLAGASVTIGPAVEAPAVSPDIITTQPVRIEAPSFSRRDGVDTPLRFAHTLQDYQQDAGAVYYMRGHDTGTLYVPEADGYELHLWVRLEILTGQATIALHDVLTLPNGYRQALVYGLAAELCPTFSRSMQTTAQMEQRAANAMRRLKKANFVSQQLVTMPGHAVVVSV